MENDVVVRRDDGSVINGISLSEWDRNKKLYDSLLDQEMINLIDSYGPAYDRYSFSLCAAYLDSQKKHEKEYGKQASFATSLFMLLSVHVKPKKSSSLSVFGEITSGSGYHPNECCIYKRESKDAEDISDGGYLTLNGPSASCSPDDVCFLLRSRKLSIRLCDGAGQFVLFEDDNIMLDYSEGCFEQVVQDKVYQNPNALLTLKYISIPIAVYGKLGIAVFNRVGYGNLSKYLDVHGKVVAKYKNTCGNYESEEIVLFDKSPNQYERVLFKMFSNSLSLQRCWVAAPAYSLLCLHIELFDSESNIISTQDVELETNNSYRSSKEFICGQYVISVSSSWSDISRQEGYDDQIYRSLELRTTVRESTIEVFSVLICHDKCMPIQIHGRLQFNTFFASVDFIEEGFEIFKREKEAPLTLLGRADPIPLLNVGSRVLCNHFPVSLICDLNGTIDAFNIKGYQTFYDDSCLDKHLCSVFRGDHGFAALHFSIFRTAVQANLQVFVYHKGLQCAVFGNICAQYKCFDYSSQYKKNWYSIVFFKKGREEMVQMDADGSVPLSTEEIVQMDAVGWIPLVKSPIPLSRSSFVVPSYSSSRFDLDLTIGAEKFTQIMNVTSDTTTTNRRIKGKECLVEFVFEWSYY